MSLTSNRQSTCQLTLAQMVGMRTAMEITRIDVFESILIRSGYVPNSRSWIEAWKIATEIWTLHRSSSTIS